MRIRPFLLAIACYTAISAWFYWDVLRAPATVLPQLVGIPEKQEALGWADQQMVAATIASVARRLFTAPTHIHDLGQCYPFPDSLVLGEPMFVNALVAAVPYALTGSPIFAKNFVTVTAPILAGLAMFALILYWTNSVPAALVAGLLFGFEPGRLVDPGHPYIHGNAWTPLALLAAHRLFARQRWRDAALLATTLTLQMLESFYPALALAMVGCVYGTVLAIHHRRELPALLPKLVAVTLFVALVGVLAFRPYFANRETWGILQGRDSWLLLPADFHFGGLHYLGTVLLLLAAVALLERVRRGAGLVFDPRLPLLVAGVFIYWFVCWRITIPLVGGLESLYLLGLRDLPGVSAVRVVTAVSSALPFVGACLAGFGLAILLRHRGSFTRATLGALVFALAAGEIFFFPRSGAAFGARLRVLAVAPSAPLLALLDTLPDGPVLDFPPSLHLPPTTHYLLLHGYHDRSTDACYSSFSSPVQDEVITLSSRLPDSIAALRLRTLGFRAIVVHTEFLAADRLERFTEWVEKDGRLAAGLHRIGEADGHVVYAFGPAPPTVGLDALTLPAIVFDRRVQTLTAPGQTIGFVIRNLARRPYRRPDPIRPDAVVLTWLDDQGVAHASERLTVLLPIVLAPGGKQILKIAPATLPPPGAYVVTLRLRDAEGPVVGRQRVVVTAPEAPEPVSPSPGGDLAHPG
jgi:hypothetical protein